MAAALGTAHRLYWWRCNTQGDIVDAITAGRFGHNPKRLQALKGPSYPFVTTGGTGALPLPIGVLPLPAQPATLIAKSTEQAIARNLFIAAPKALRDPMQAA